MLTSAITTPANHLLRNEKWGRERLCAYAGKTICIQSLPLMNIKLQINVDGELQPVAGSHSIDVVLMFSPLLVPSLLAQDPVAFDRIQITGDENLAEALIVIGKHINWGAILAQDASSFVGDIAAYRLGRTAAQLLQWQARHFDRMAQTISEYLVEEQDYLIKDASIHRFSEEVQNLQHDAEQLEQRLMQLKQRSMLRGALAKS